MKAGDKVLLVSPHIWAGHVGVVDCMAVDGSGDAIVKVKLDAKHEFEEPVSKELMEKVIFWKKDTTITGAIIAPSSLDEICLHIKSMLKWSKKKVMKTMIDSDIFNVEGVKFSMNSNVL